MKDYVISVCFVLLFCTGIRLVTPGKGYGGIIKIVCGVFVVSVIASPIVRLAKTQTVSFDFDSFIRDDSGFFELADKAKTDFEKQLSLGGGTGSRDALARELSLVFDCTITVDRTDDNWVIRGAPLNKKDQIADYVLRYYGLRVEVD